MDTLRQTARTATSKPVQRAVINTALLGFSIATLLGIATIASVLFFQNFVPDRAISSPVYLQYGSSPNPFGIASLKLSLLKTQQDYDLSLTLTMPRSPANLERGNFMVGLYLIGSGGRESIETKAQEFANTHAGFGTHKVLSGSRRPVLIPYMDPVVSLTTRVLFLGYHLLFPKSQNLIMTIPLAEDVSFSTTTLLPTAAYVEIEAGQNIEVYDCELTFTARLHGLRWLMIHFRLLSFATFTMAFWCCEVLFMSAAWTMWTLWSNTGENKNNAVSRQVRQRSRLNPNADGTNNEDETYDNAFGLQRLGEADIKYESDENRFLPDIPTGGGEADDEAEDHGDIPADTKFMSRSSVIATGLVKKEGENMRWRTARSDLE